MSVLNGQAYEGEMPSQFGPQSRSTVPFMMDDDTASISKPVVVALVHRSDIESSHDCQVYCARVSGRVPFLDR